MTGFLAGFITGGLLMFVLWCFVVGGYDDED